MEALDGWGSPVSRVKPPGFHLQGTFKGTSVWLDGSGALFAKAVLW